MANNDITRLRRGKNQQLTPRDPRSQGTPKRPLRRSGIASIVVMALAGSLVATVALPAYAFAPTSPETRATASTELTRTSAQAVEVPTQATTVSAARDGFTATTTAQLAAAKAARVASAAAAARANATVASSTSASSARAAAISQPKTFMVNSVFAAAARYQGVPYVFGGASPSGFDCSGLVKYAWAKFGKSLPHSSNAQAAMGHRISRAAARPGDLVVLPGHIGFYAGNGKILHAPYPGQRVRIQPIWTNNYYIVRL